jgi:hypothetical protein
MHQPSPVASLRIAEFALLFGSLVFAGVVAYLTSAKLLEGPSPLPEAANWAAAAFAVFALPLSFVLRRTVENSLRNTPGMRSDEAHARARVLGMTVFEAAILINLVFWLLSGEQWPNAVAAVIPFCAGLVQALTPMRTDAN